jgi:poly(hydroxyalkanoate) granule-associated protein
MMDVFRKAFLAGMGAMSLSSEHASKLVDELVEAGELRQKEGRDLVDEIVKKAGEVKKHVESTIAKQMDAAHERMNLASLARLKEMEGRIQELEKKLTQASRTPRSAKNAAASARRTGKKAAGK